MPMTKSEIEAMDDHTLGQEYYWALDIDPYKEAEVTRLLVAEVDRRKLSPAQMGEPFEGMEAVTAVVRG